MNKTFRKTLELFQSHGGMLRTAQARQLGIAGATLPRMVAAGLLVCEARGLYRLANMPPLGNPDLVIIATRLPAAIVCLISALDFHGLTTQIPNSIYIALPRSVKEKPRIASPPLDIVWLSEKPYTAGIETHILDGVEVRIYGREKTLADCFKFRKKIGMDVALEALKDYMQQPGAYPSKVMEYAKINRVANVMRPYLEALV
jgi:predicted transcriptional regulator of viral defense system